MARTGTRTITGRHVLLAMLGLFGVVIAVNALFVYLALTSFTGVTSAKPYQEGLAYNEVLAARAAQRDLGWQATLTVAENGSSETITLALTDEAGRPLAGLDLSGLLRRPTHAGIDQALVWQEAAPGAYRAEVILPERGNWDLVVRAGNGSDQALEMEKRLWFK